MKQTTIAKKIKSINIGLHKGEPIKMSLEPLGANSGIVFRRSDIDMKLQAKPQNIVNTEMATVIGNEVGYISTIEHLMSAIYAYGIDNLLVTVDGNEIPVMDGSAASFCMMLDEAGKKELDANKKALIIKKEVKVKDGDKYVKISPSNKPIYKYKIDFAHPIIGVQELEHEFKSKTYKEEIGRARTFGFLKDVEYLRSRGLALGGSLENAIVIDENKILNPEGLRYKNEFVRHKILDAIGDLAVLSTAVLGKYESFSGSHKLNHMLTKEILKDTANYEIVELSEEKADELAKAFA